MPIIVVSNDMLGIITPPIQAENAMFQPVQSESNAFEPFLMQPRNQKFLRGEARYPAFPSRSQFILVGVFLLVGVVLLVLAATDLITDERLQQAGVTTQGTVIKRRISSGKNTNYYITYRFKATAQGSEPVFYAHEQQVSSASYNSHPEQTSVSVAYLKDDPATSKLTGKDTDDSARNSMLFFGAIWLTMTIVLLVVTVRPILQDRWLAQRGEIIEGQLVKCSGRMTGGKGSYYKLTADYQFCTPDGRTVFGKQNASRNDLRRSTLPAPNTPVAVLYVDDQHHKLL